MEKNNNSTWIFIITVLFILNIILSLISAQNPYLIGCDKIKLHYILFVFFIISAGAGGPFSPAGGYFLLLLSSLIILPLSILNVILPLIFIIRQRPNTKSKIIIYTFLAISIYLLIRLVIK
jgi:hypothetical protein